jgi:uncharacterized protein (TIGR00369 family)
MSPHGLPPGFEPPVPLERCFDAQYGLNVLADPADGTLRARVAVRPAVRDRNGDLALGVLAAAAEALASRGTAFAVMPDGLLAQGLSNDTTVIRRVAEGHVDVMACLIARGPETWVWSVEATDEAGRVCSVSRVTVAVRAPR